MPVVLVISAPSGTGKSTLIRKLREVESNLAYAVSVTTREPRGEEVDGEAYRFVTDEVFSAMVERGEFLEWASVFGHRYGTPWSAVMAARKSGQDLVLDIDVQGAALLKKQLPEAVRVFILPPVRESLERRLRDRSTDEEATIKRRLREAANEVGLYRDYDYVVVNDDVEDALSRLRGVLTAERSKRINMAGRIAHILGTFGIRD